MRYAKIVGARDIAYSMYQQNYISSGVFTHEGVTSVDYLDAPCSLTSLPCIILYPGGRPSYKTGKRDVC